MIMGEEVSREVGTCRAWSQVVYVGIGAGGSFLVVWVVRSWGEFKVVGEYVLSLYESRERGSDVGA